MYAQHIVCVAIWIMSTTHTTNILVGFHIGGLNLGAALYMCIPSKNMLLSRY